MLLCAQRLTPLEKQIERILRNHLEMPRLQQKYDLLHCILHINLRTIVQLQSLCLLIESPQSFLRLKMISSQLDTFLLLLRLLLILRPPSG